MVQKERDKGPLDLVDAIVEGMRRKKGIEIVNIDLSGEGEAECDNFIICHGSSNTHVDAIARSVEESVEELAFETVWRQDGFQNAQWILLDYVNVMVHIFQEPFRRFYDLESLWGDGTIYNIEADI
ncbi:MAG: ribosome silencing factor [Prolixibacteraceae bacterium]|nr:ribosome silencing factor [Prolixibacteraceae bacterium]